MGLRDIYVRYLEKKWEQKSPGERAAIEATMAERDAVLHAARLSRRPAAT
jgi:hypothetical protein